MIVDCPWCGMRDAAEFQYRGELIARPDGDDLDAWRRYLYSRRNHNGVVAERWYHGRGCRSFLRIERDVTSNRIMTVVPE